MTRCSRSILCRCMRGATLTTCRSPSILFGLALARGTMLFILPRKEGAHAVLTTCCSRFLCRQTRGAALTTCCSPCIIHRQRCSWSCDGFCLRSLFACQRCTTQGLCWLLHPISCCWNDDVFLLHLLANLTLVFVLYIIFWARYALYFERHWHVFSDVSLTPSPCWVMGQMLPLLFDISFVDNDPQTQQAALITQLHLVSCSCSQQGYAQMLTTSMEDDYHCSHQ